MEKSRQIELVVIGAGPGGYAAAFRAADLGKQVLLIDRDPELGGVCLNRGCIPSKALLHICKVMEEATNLEKMGVKYGKPEIDIGKIRDYKNKIVSQLNSGIAQIAKARKVETVQGLASFVSNTELKVQTGTGDVSVTFGQCIIACGSSSAMIPGLPTDHPSVITSRTALNLDDVPERLLVIGGGIVGLELGQVYAVLGSKVSIIEYLPNILPGTDPDLVKPLQRKLKKQCEAIQVSSKVTKVEPSQNDTLTATIKKDKGSSKEVFNKVLVSVGRKPNTGLLNTEATDIKVNDIIETYELTEQAKTL